MSAPARTWLAAALALAAACGGSAAGPRAPTPQQTSAIAELHELLELRLDADAARRARFFVAPGGLLARDGEGLALAARALLATGAGDEAEQLLARASPATPEDQAFVDVERARQALERDELEAVEALLAPTAGAEAPVRHPELPEAWLVLARARARSGQLARAEPLARGFAESAPLHPEAPSAWHLVYLAAIERGDGGAAEQAERAERDLRSWHEIYAARRLQVRQAPDDPLPRLGLALCWMQIGDHQRAERDLADLVRRHPTFCRGWFQLGEAQRHLGNAAEARVAWTRALECDPADGKSRYNRGLLSVLEGKRAEARADFEAMLGTPAEADPQFAGVFLQLARLDLADGRRAEADERYARYQAAGGREPLEPPR